MANPNGNKDTLKPFKKGRSGNPKGRPPFKKFVANILGVNPRLIPEGMSSKDMKKALSTLLQMSGNEILAVTKDQDSPIWFVAMATAISKQMKQGKTDAVEKLMDRVYGKSVQALEHSGKDGQELPPIIFLQAPDDDDNSSK